MVDFQFSLNPNFNIYFDGAITVKVNKTPDILKNCIYADLTIRLFNEYLFDDESLDPETFELDTDEEEGTTLCNKFPALGLIWDLFNPEAKHEFVTKKGTMLYSSDETSIQLRFELNEDDYKHFLEEYKEM